MRWPSWCTLNLTINARVTDALLQQAALEFQTLRSEIAAMDARIQASIDSLVAAVAEQRTVIDGAAQTIDGYEVQLAECQARIEELVAAAGMSDADVQAVVEPLSDLREAVTASKQALLDALVVNTTVPTPEPTPTPSE